jgi:hypothetical protein
MRTTQFKHVFDSVLRWHGINTRKQIPADLADTVVFHINDRVRTICLGWDWPEWTVTEERAYRQIWNATDQYLRMSAEDNLPEEVFYLGAAFSTGGPLGTGSGYYRVLSTASGDPPVGTVPTNTTYWVPITPVDTFIAYDQRCRRAIGEMLGVYRHNPLSPSCGHNGLMRYRPSQRGIEVCGAGNPTTFISYKIPVPEYTITPYLIGKTYSRGDVVFDPVTNECFQALAATTAAPTDRTYWLWVPFLTKWEDYVVNGAFADGMMESDQHGDQDIQQRMVKKQEAEERATDSLQTEVDSLTSQGQILKWNPFRHHHGHHGWCHSQPWTGGGSVSTLTDACQDGFAFPVPPPPSPDNPCDTTYHDEIVAIKTVDGTPSLQGLNTTTRAITCTLITIVIIVDGSPESQQWRLDAGPADSMDAGQLAPSDYSLVYNNKHWLKVG